MRYDIVWANSAIDSTSTGVLRVSEVLLARLAVHSLAYKYEYCTCMLQFCVKISKLPIRTRSQSPRSLTLVRNLRFGATR
jgi:hypothetical protein